MFPLAMHYDLTQAPRVYPPGVGASQASCSAPGGDNGDGLTGLKNLLSRVDRADATLPKSQLDPAVQKLVRKLFDPSNMERAMQALQLDLEKVRLLFRSITIRCNLWK